MQKTVNELQGTVNNMLKTVDEVQKKQTLHNVVAVVKFPEYHQHQLSQQMWYSPAFYTSPGGYRMCVRINVLAIFVSVFVHLMQGKNDDNLPWPFTGMIAITLLNQLGDENHYALGFLFPQDDEASRKVVGGERALKGYGYQQFILHDRLEKAPSCKYLKDDCLYFRIEVQAAKPVKPWLVDMHC